MLFKGLIFSDLCVGQETATSWYKATPDSLRIHQIPDRYTEELMALRKHLDERYQEVPKFRKDEGNDFRISWPADEPCRMRVNRKTLGDGQIVYLCRTWRFAPGQLSELGMPVNIANKFMQQDLTEGLVLFMGKAGSGKSTTMASFVISRLEIYGGSCWTIENPIEFPLQGFHGPGVCNQIEVFRDSAIGEEITGIYRATPNIIMIGEIRDSATAREAILAGTSGHLVCATMFAPSLSTGISRLSDLAGEGMESLLADSLRVAVHQVLRNKEDRILPGDGNFSNDKSKGTGDPPRVLSVSPLWADTKMSEAIKSVLRDGQFHMLSSEIQRQQREFMSTVK